MRVVRSEGDLNGWTAPLAALQIAFGMPLFPWARKRFSLLRALPRRYRLREPLAASTRNLEGTSVPLAGNRLAVAE